MADWTQLG